MTDCQLNEYGTTIAAADDSGSLVVLNTNTNQTYQLSDLETGLATAHNGCITKLAWSHVSQSLVASASVDGHLKVWKEVQQGKW